MKYVLILLYKMSSKTRLIILLSCIVCFFTASPLIVAYSMGYRFDFERMKIVATGGIYVRTFPSADSITIDSKVSVKPGMFANSIFVQSLLPKNHTVLVQKSGYYDYLKTLPTEENQVAKLENILLFKKDIKFQKLADSAQSPFLPENQLEKFIIKSNNLYFSDTPQNSSIAAAEKKVAVIKNVLAFKELSGNILWLGSDGFLYQSDQDGKNPKKLVLKPIKIVKGGYYKITADSQNLFLNNNFELLQLNRAGESLEAFAESVRDAKISPDGRNLIYFNSSQIHIFPLHGQLEGKILLQQSDDKITDVFWLNNYYIIFSAGNKILISETDYRGNINTITLAQDFTLPKIIFKQSEDKLYVLTDSTVVASEKLLP